MYCIYHVRPSINDNITLLYTVDWILKACSGSMHMEINFSRSGSHLFFERVPEKARQAHKIQLLRTPPPPHPHPPKGSKELLFGSFFNMRVVNRGQKGKDRGDSQG